MQMFRSSVSCSFMENAGGGRVDTDHFPSLGWYELKCRRCGAHRVVNEGENTAAQVVLTAIDGRDRTFESEFYGTVLVPRRANAGSCT